MSKIHYVYLTTDLINGKQYIGDHTADNIDDGYLGSGTLIIRSINKYGKENFKKEICEYFSNKKDAGDAQEKYIKLYNTHVSRGGYNISWKGGHQHINSISEETRKKLSEVRKGKKLSEETKQKMGKTRRERGLTAGIKNGMYGSSLYEKMLYKYGKELADIKFNEWKIKNGEKQKLRKTSEKTKQKRSETIKNKPKLICPYCKIEMDASNYKRYHGENCKYNPSGKGFLMKFKKLRCPYCNKEMGINNYYKYHGENCKYKSII